MHHVNPHPAQQFLKGLMTFAAIHHQRVPLPVGVEADAGSQVFHRGQMVDPMKVNGSQQQQPFQSSHLFRTQVRLARLIDRFGVVRELLDQFLLLKLVNLILVGQVRGQGANQDQFGYKAGCVPVVGVAAGQVFGYQVAKLLAQHLDDLFP